MAFHRANSFQQDAIEIHPDLLYFWVTRRGEAVTVPPSSGLVLHIDNELKYEPFANDFGPLHLGCTYRFCRKLSFLLKESAKKSKPVIFVTGSHPHRKGNAAVLLGAWLILFEDYTGEAAYSAIQRAEPFTPFRDASCGHSQFGLTVKHVLAGIYKAKQVGFIDWHQPHSTFNLRKYEYYEQVINGDWNWIIPDKFLAFSGPTCRTREQSIYGTLGCLEYVPLFRQEGITGIVRLNKPQYDKRDFTAAGFSHYDLYFPDGTTPPSSILSTFLNIAETEPGAIAVHCKAGLGRTGTLIGCYIMKHYGFTAAEVIAYIRLCRPGSILGPQQIYLHEQQARMWTAGNQQPQSASLGAVPRNLRATVPAAVSAPARSRSLSSSQTRGAVSQPSAQRVTAVPYTTKPSSSMGAVGSSSAGAATSDVSSLSTSQQRQPETAAESAQVVRTLASNGQPRKVLAPSAPTESSSTTQPTSLGSTQREYRRTASNGQPRKGLSFSRLTENRQTSFRNR